ncbi:TonB-dependent receptor [Mucilaginibacter sp.]|uniref:SusC/RagA family TonB-linked outer membrane protein n=1 Tax=Mucilaginibacter sp. TaxID=1882438 RepID=UPI002626D969|nr:TonB-dependent receptor [Mucilaginibacter sp.]
MYKIYNAFICGKKFCCSKKSLLIMKLTMVLLTMAFMQASAKSSNVVGTTLEVAQKTITGKVVDEKGLPLPGVIVKSKSNATNVTTTDAQGNYKLVSTDDNATIIYSFVGYETQEQSSRGKTVINVTMVPTNSNLDEVVVVAYGTQKRTSVTGAVGTINAAEIKRNSVTDLTNAIVGRTPGVRVTTVDANPGLYNTNIDIRGYTGAAGGYQNPLFVIDGIPRDKASFDHLDPNEIESFSVLKDASAAIYGVQAANGVILVTTRKGAAGKVQVNYTGQGGVVLILTYPKLQNSYQEETTYDEMLFNRQIANRDDPITPKWTSQNIQDAFNGKGTSVDWLSTLENSRSNQYQHNVNLSGGSDKVQFFTSGGYIHEGGLLSTNIESSDKYNARQSVTAEITKGLTFDVNIGFIDQLYSRPNQSTARYYVLTRNTWGFTPQDPIYLNDNPKYFNQAIDNGGDNPLATITRSVGGYDDMNAKQFTSVTGLTWVVPHIKGLTAKVQVGWDNNNSLEKQQIKAFNQYNWNFTTNSLNTYNHGGIGGLTQLSENYIQSMRNDLQFSLNYNKHFGKHNFSALALYEALYNESDNLTGTSAFAVDVLDLLNAGLAVGQSARGGKNINSNESYVGRLNYDYAGKYLLEGGFRYEGSSYFPPSGRWGFFPYVSGGWRISEESFIKNNFKWIDNIKLRGSYGTTGDDQGAAGSFPAFTTGYTYPSVNSIYQPSTGGRNGGLQVGTVFGTTGGTTKGVDYKSIANPDITWYTSTTADIGLETSFWHSLLTFEADVFSRTRHGLLATRLIAIPGNFGGTLPQVNLNSDRTRGFEITLGHRGVSGEVSYGISTNMGFSRSNWIHNEQAPRTNPYDNWLNNSENRYVDFIRGRTVVGQFQSYADIYAYKPIIDNNGNRTVLPGDLKYQDTNGDGIIDGNDETILANGGLKPLVFFGMTVDATWKGLDVTFLIQGATNYNVNYTDALSQPFIRDPQDPITEYIDRWHHQDLFDQNSPWVPGKWPSTAGPNDRSNRLQNKSTFTVFDGSYARLKQVQVGYTFPKKLLSKINISKLRIFASAYNVFTVHGKGLSFVDPEYTDSNPQSGGSNYNAPLVMNITAGANITF